MYIPFSFILSSLFLAFNMFQGTYIWCYDFISLNALSDGPFYGGDDYDYYDV